MWVVTGLCWKTCRAPEGKGRRVIHKGVSEPRQRLNPATSSLVVNSFILAYVGRVAWRDDPFVSRYWFQIIASDALEFFPRHTLYLVRV